MAALASSAVSVYPTGADRYIGNKTDVVQRNLKLVLTGQGGATNTIAAAALGFSKLISCSSANDPVNGKVIHAAVDPVAGTINLSVTAADTYADYTGTVYLSVTGNPALAR